MLVSLSKSVRFAESLLSVRVKAPAVVTLPTVVGLTLDDHERLVALFRVVQSPRSSPGGNTSGLFPAFGRLYQGWSLLVEACA